MRPSFTNARRSPAGDTAGSSPSAMNLGADPPAVGTDQICTRGCVVALFGFGCRLPSAGQLAP